VRDAIPERLVNFEKESETGCTVLLVPRFRQGLLARFLQPRLKNPYIRVTLDRLGTFVWERCDGTKTIGEIADEMKVCFGEDAKDAEQRIITFLNTLYRGRLVRFWKRS